AKRKNSLYQAGKRSNAWLKIKPTQTAEFVVGGYTKGKGEREPLGALLLGYWTDGKLQYAGHVGSGLTGTIIDGLHTQIASLARKRAPFRAEVRLHRPTRWLQPRLVGEVPFQDWTRDGLLRAPVFVRLREDIARESVTGAPAAPSDAAAHPEAPAAP